MSATGLCLSACNFTHKEAGESVTADDFSRAGIETGDIVLAWGRVEHADNVPYIAVEAMDWLLETRIKLLAIEHLGFAPPATPHGSQSGDGRLLLSGIPIVDGPTGLDQIRKGRVFFMALPVRLQRVTASWTRAIALEEI